MESTEDLRFIASCLMSRLQENLDERALITILGELLNCVVATNSEVEREAVEALATMGRRSHRGTYVRLPAEEHVDLVLEHLLQQQPGIGKYQKPERVYFAAESSGRYMKIGASSNPHKRLARLRTSMNTWSCVVPHDIGLGKLELLGVVPGSFQREKELHAHFFQHRAVGEWFRVEGAVAELRLELETGSALGEPLLY